MSEPTLKVYEALMAERAAKKEAERAKKAELKRQAQAADRQKREEEKRQAAEARKQEAEAQKEARRQLAAEAKAAKKAASEGEGTKGVKPAPPAPSVVAPRAMNPAMQAAVEEAFTLPYEPPSYHFGPNDDPYAEIAQRELCRRKILPFIQRFRPKYNAGWVHEDICRRVERFVEQVEQGLSPRLLLLCPPRTGKSEIGSRHVAPWALGKHPDWEIIATSNSASLSLSFSRYIRDVMRDPGYQAVFPEAKLDPSSQSVENWNLTKGGGYMAAGVGTGIVGRGCHILLVDDVVRDMEAADSPTIRDNIWEWYLCFHPETEVLTATGWKLVSEVAVGEPVATMDAKTDEMYYMPATETQSYDFDGELVDCFQRSGVSFRVTPNHNIPVSSSLTGPVKMVRADELPQTAYVPRAAKVFLGGTPPARTGFRAKHANGKDFECSTLDWLRFLGAYLGDGCVTLSNGSIRLSAVKPRKRAFFSRLLERLNVRFWEQEACVSFQNKVVAEYLHTLGKAEDKFVPQNIKWANNEHLEALLEGLLETDGHAAVPGHRYRYVTKSKQLADDVMEIAVKCGYAVSYSIRPNGCFHISLRKALRTQLDTRSRGRTKSEVISRTPYTGKVHCLTVPPHHMVLIRDRGRISWCGQSVAYTRLAPGGGVLGILTWWNEDDWAGRIIQAMESGEGDVFEIVKYPAINDEGDEYILADDTMVQIPQGQPVPPGARLTRTMGTAIHPARYTTQQMLNIKRNFIAGGQKRIWDALYQQNPTPDDGNYFTREMFRYYGTAPARSDLYVYQAWDFAISEGKESDYTVGMCIGVDHRDNVYVLDVKRFKSGDGGYIIDTILDFAAEWNADQLGFEDGQIWKAIEFQFQKRCEERRQYPSFELLKPLTDKMVRANPLKGRMQLGKVYFDKNAPWFDALYRELIIFPAGKHDDCVDGLSWAVRLTLARAAPKDSRPVAKLKSWKDKLGVGGALGGTHMAA